MRDLLFLCHRLPYPPDKGEKIRAWHMFAHLAKTYRMHLGCLIDTAEDWGHVPAVQAMCADMHAAPFDGRWQRVRALASLRPGRALTPGYFSNPGLQAWVNAKCRTGVIDRVFVFSSGMAGYVMGKRGYPDRTLDMVDVDSAKWAAYAQDSRFPARLVWAREARLLLAFERRVATEFDRTLLVSAAECAHFAALAPEAAGRVFDVENGVDLARFSPALAFPPAFTTPGPHLVFTGTMDYRPNIDAVTWFVAEMLPALRRARPELVFHIVGANPAPQVLALAGPAVRVTGRVADVRPYVAQADVVVVPLRIARGIQNKLLEAMAMGRPVVASLQAFEGVRAVAGQDLLVADGPAATVAAVLAVLDGAHPGLGAAGRRAMEQGYDWAGRLARLDTVMGSV